MGKRFFMLLLTVLISSQSGVTYSTENNTAYTDPQCVVLLHGLGRSWRSMWPLQQALQTAKYKVVNFDYPSQKQSIDALALKAIPQGLALCEKYKAKTIHFVTHSLGGILLRYYLTQQDIALLGRVVMLSPPNHGSEVVDSLKHMDLYQWYNGPAGLELGTDANSLPINLSAVTYPVGVIAGNKHSFFDVYFSSLIPGDNDGKVSVESTKLEGMSDFLVVAESHPFIMRSDLVIKQVLYFLQHGAFQHPAQ